MGNRSLLSRRMFTIGGTSLIGLTLAGCATGKTKTETISSGPTPKELAAMYGPMPNERFPIPAVHLKQIEPRFYRQRVPFETDEKVGTVIVNTKTFFAHLVQENGMAIRYGVGVGREGFEWSGTAIVGRKTQWPKWTPPASMIKRQPELEEFSAANGGMPPGIDNPLGARALYLYKNGRDTLYRLHGTIEAYSIGKAVSSGCIRFLNQDIIDLYRRVPVGTKVIVI